MYDREDVEFAIDWFEQHFPCVDYDTYRLEARHAGREPVDTNSWLRIDQAMMQERPRLEKERLERALKHHRERIARNQLRRWRGPRIIS